jgi:thiamine pyrophosphokinase
MSAIRWACAEGFDEICLVCALGARLDHSYANLQALAWAAEQGALAAIDSPDERVFALRNAKLKLQRREGFSLSVFAVSGRCRVSIRGVKYALEDAEISSVYPVGVSNEWVSSEAEITVREGTILIMESRL